MKAIRHCEAHSAEAIQKNVKLDCFASLRYSRNDVVERNDDNFVDKYTANYLAVSAISSIFTAQHSTAQHSTAQHSTAQHSTAQHSTAQHSTAFSLL